MNHNLGVRLEQGQFIEIRKVSGTAQCETRILSVTFFKKQFNGIKAGDLVYFTKLRKEKYMISRTPYSNLSYSKRILAGANDTLKLYINEKDFVAGGYYSFYEYEDHLILKKSTLKEIEMRNKCIRTFKSGLVSSDQNSISIQKKDIPFFKKEYGYRVKVYQGANLYIKITMIPKENICKNKTLRSLSKKEKTKEMFEYDAEVKKLLHGRQLYVPITFLRNVKMRRGDHFDIKMENEKTMLLIPKKQKDEITNELFDPFETRRKIVTVNQREKSEIKSIQNIKDQMKFDLPGMLEEMRKINNQYI